VGVDITASALDVAAAHGVAAVRGSVLGVPLADGCADVVVAGEVLEHVADDVAVLEECARLLTPGGTLVIDAVADTLLADVIAVRIAERLRGAPRGIHDPDLFVDRARLLAAADRFGLDLRLVGLRPSVVDVLGWLRHRRDGVRMVPLRTTAVLFAGYGRKR
jgi:2-polyprenyl-6-hydroxyphenyl methylase/3-demethylubiquinone-9 3-methyltransferase